MDLLLTKYIRANIDYEGITRTETYDFPEAALREAVLNAIVHKDYTSGNPIQISVYDKMIWISNSGTLPQGWTVETLKKHHKSEPANPDIANVFFRAGYIEVWGRGTINIVNYCKKAGLPEPDFNFDSGLTVLFKKEDKSYDELASIDFGKTSVKTSVKILEYIKENAEITILELSQKTNKKTRAIEMAINKLKEQGKLKHIGPDKGGHWEVVEEFLEYYPLWILSILQEFFSTNS